MWLKKATGGSAIGQYAWVKDGDVAEVPDPLAEQLLAIPGNDFTAVPPPGTSTSTGTEAAVPAQDSAEASAPPAATASNRGRGKTVKE